MAGPRENSAPLSTPATAAPPGSSRAAGEDKIYNSIFFTDQNNGWVVGEFGLIYHTADGGKNWQKQECTDIMPVVDETQWETPTPSLYSVWFSDAQHGWAAGMDSRIIATDGRRHHLEKNKEPGGSRKLTLYKIVAREGQLWAVGQKGT